MGNKRQISRYITECLRKGISYRNIKDSLLRKGYPANIAEGIILDYRHKGRLIKWSAVSVMSVFFLISMYLSGSGIAGMATLGYSQNYIDETGLIINQSSSYSWYVPHKGRLISVAFTGNLLGGGSAKAYLEHENKKYLVFSSEKQNFQVTDISSSILGSAKHFNTVCEQACYLPELNKSVYSFVFEINNSVLEIEKIHYDIKAAAEVESVPEFLDIPDQEVSVNSRLAIDLNTFFNSSEKPEFSYLSRNISVEINDNLAAISPENKGTYHVYFIAELGSLKFMSNLVRIEVTDSGSSAGIIRGAAVHPQKKEKPSPRPLPNLLLLSLVIAVIITLAVIPSRFYDTRDLASKLDRIRKSSRLSSSIEKYNKMKETLNSSIPEKEKSKLLYKMEKGIRALSKELPGSDIQHQFDEKCREFRSAKSRGIKECIYNELRQVYEKMIESGLPQESKKEAYRKLQRYYKQI
ncbi:hypothetical protein GF323_02100 [Candidatus Woesearchaeota archaeon]|nr:hypothetical protein [Candidatus Woesearchaeota archaeon]